MRLIPTCIPINFCSFLKINHQIPIFYSNMTSACLRHLVAGLLLIAGVSAPLVTASPTDPALGIRQTTPADYWKPTAGTTWQIQLNSALTSTSYDAQVYDIDMEENTAATIQTLHNLGRKVICYFSAGSYESVRPDASQFLAADKGKKMDGWPEYWIDTRSPNVRRIMTARIDAAKAKGCDGIDPDNVDGYQNDSGFPLTTATAIDYMKFLADAAHSRGMSIGLKNSLDIVNQTLGYMDWQVNEECQQYFIDGDETQTECVKLKPYIAANKPVFHIEYPDGAPGNVDPAVRKEICENPDVKGFSTLLKDMDLTAWVDAC